MNRGYANSMSSNPVDEVCCLCGSDIYINKYGTDYCCMNKDCKLNKGSMKLIKEIDKVMDFYREERCK